MLQKINREDNFALKSDLLMIRVLPEVTDTVHIHT